MPSIRQAATNRSLLLLSTGFFLGAVFSRTMKSGCNGAPDSSPLSSTVTRKDFQKQYTNEDPPRYASSRAASLVHLPLDGVPTPVESSLRFAAANEAGSDKVSLHSYHLMYGPFLAPFLPNNVSLLEIGVFDGASLRLWGNLFPNHGDAVAQGFKKELTSKLALYTGDQSDTKFLQQMKADLDHKLFDIIVDDGSHVPWHQLLTFEIMFETWLKPGGIYIIEDVETSYLDGTNPRIYGYDIIDAGLGKKGSVVEKFKWIIDVLNRKFIDSDPAFSIFKSKIDHLVSHIAFSENCIILWKRAPSGLEAEWDRVTKNNADFSRKRRPGILNMFSRKVHQKELPRGKRGLLSRLASKLRIFLFG